LILQPKRLRSSSSEHHRTAIILKIISFFIPLRASDGDVEGGDLAIHGIDPVPYPA